MFRFYEGEARADLESAFSSLLVNHRADVSFLPLEWQLVVKRVIDLKHLLDFGLTKEVDKLSPEMQLGCLCLQVSLNKKNNKA